MRLLEYSDHGYDNADRLTTMTDQAYTTFGTITYNGLATYVYSYDQANRVTTQVNAEGTYTYTYDHSNEEIGVFKSGTQVESYSYDLNGNRTGTGYHTTVMNEVTTAPGHTYTYDNAGDLVSDNNGTTITTYTYDYRNRVTEVTQGGTVTATYTYNALDQRIGIKDNGTQTWTTYAGMSADAHPYADFNGSGGLTMRYLSAPGVFNGALTSVILARTSSSGSIAWYLTDRLGSVRDIVNASGTMLDHIVYDSFGNIVTQTNATNGDRYMFGGMEFDATTGIYYDHARYFDAATGRFPSQDSQGFAAGDTNLYRYVGNAPTIAIDPSGHFNPVLAGAVIGGISGFIVGATMQAVNVWEGGVFDPGAVGYATFVGAAGGAFVGLGFLIVLPEYALAVGELGFWEVLNTNYFMQTLIIPGALAGLTRPDPVLPAAPGPVAPPPVAPPPAANAPPAPQPPAPPDEDIVNKFFRQMAAHIPT